MSTVSSGGDFNPFSYTQAAQLDKKIAQTEIKTKTPEIKNDPKTVTTPTVEPIKDSKDVKEVKGAEFKNKLPEGLFDKIKIGEGLEKMPGSKKDWTQVVIEKEVSSIRESKGSERDSKLLNFQNQLDKLGTKDLKVLRDYLVTEMASPTNKDDQLLGALLKSVNKEIDSRGDSFPRTTLAMGENGSKPPIFDIKPGLGKIDFEGATTKSPGEEGGSKIDLGKIDFGSLGKPIAKLPIEDTDKEHVSRRERADNKAGNTDDGKVTVKPGPLGEYNEKDHVSRRERIEGKEGNPKETNSAESVGRRMLRQGGFIDDAPAPKKD